MIRVLRLAGIAALLCVSMRVEGQSQVSYLYGIQAVKSVSGVLQDDAGTPLPNALVQEFSPNWKSVLRTTKTDSDGGFSFATVEGRQIYWLQVSAPGFNPLRMQLKLDRERGASLKLKLKSIAQLASERDAMLAAEPNRIVFALRKMSCPEQTEFLSGDYKIVRRMSELPEAIQRLYAMRDGSKSAIADPGEEYEVGDYIGDLHRPRRRLRFAGVAKERVFVYYDHGGIGNHPHLDLFRLSAHDAVGIWHGSGWGDNLESLRHSKESDCEEMSSDDM